MAASCAACLQRIMRPSDAFVHGTEVFHRTCVHNIASSLSTQLKLEVSRLRGEVLRAELARDEAIRQRRILQNDPGQLREQLRAAERRALNAEQSVHLLNRRAIEARAAALAARDQAIQDRDAARREAALHQAIGTPARDHAPQEKIEPENDEQDDSVTRFSLLELDPLE